MLFRQPDLLDDPFLSTSYERLASGRTTAILVYTGDASNPRQPPAISSGTSP
ncbi:MAG: hypothetical protein R2849_08605 [Thermomicrobiales bacterium]